MMNRLTVLAWHNVRSSWCFPFEPDRGPQLFARQLSVLSRVARVLPLETALADLAAGRSLGPRAVALTFDDGYRDNLEVAVPLLQRHGLPATVFLVPGLLDKSVRPWWEVAGWAFTRATAPRLDWEGQTFVLGDAPARRTAFDTVSEQLKRRDQVARMAALEALVVALQPDGDSGEERMFLDWDGARDLVAAGCAIGSHTTGHAILSEESPEAQAADLTVARQQLEEGLGVPVPLVAYPNGTRRDYDAGTLAAAAAAGHRAGLTTIEAVNRADTPPYEVRRYVVSPYTGTQPIVSLRKRLARRSGGLR